jgi:hypothetical protein
MASHLNRVAIAAHLAVLLFSLYFAIGSIIAKGIQLRYKFISAVVLAAGLWLLFRRDTYLPFLGPAAFPTTAIVPELVPKDANIQVSIPIAGAAAGTKIIYWAAHADDGKVVGHPFDAYSKYENTGVATIKDGLAVIKLHCPARYRVPMQAAPLRRHVHYRLCCEPEGMLGPIQTVWIKC